MDNITIENYKNLAQNVIKWGEDKGIMIKGNSNNQFKKVVEELGELSSALFQNNIDDLIDAIGDLQVTIIINAKQNGIEINPNSYFITEAEKEHAFNVMSYDVGLLGLKKSAYSYNRAISSIYGLSYSVGLCPYECLKVAYKVISERKTKTIDGKVFKV